MVGLVGLQEFFCTTDGRRVPETRAMWRPQATETGCKTGGKDTGDHMPGLADAHCIAP